MKNERHYTMIDQICLNADQAIRTILGTSAVSERPYPAQHVQEPDLSSEQRHHSAALMRVNHAGEVCAQALYHGQALVSRDSRTRDKMKKAVIEEGEHLAWCHQRLQELQSHTSYLNPFWYTGSFVIGLIAGLCGDEWSLGFLAETELQVVQHLQEHLTSLSSEDIKSYKVIEQMQADEARHRDDAIALGAKTLPWIIKKWMRIASKIMVKTASRI